MLSFELSVIDVVLAMAIIVILLLQVKNAPSESSTEPKLSRKKRERSGDLAKSFITTRGSGKREFAIRTPEGSADCPYHFGYLRTLPLGSSVPEKCHTCSRMRDCLLSNE